MISKKINRSRNGCTNCRRLKIKCDEGKPECEYCLATGKVCEYKFVPRKPRSKTKITPPPINIIDTDLTKITNAPFSAIYSQTSRLNYSFANPSPSIPPSVSIDDNSNGSLEMLAELVPGSIDFVPPGISTARGPNLKIPANFEFTYQSTTSTTYNLEIAQDSPPNLNSSSLDGASVNENEVLKNIVYNELTKSFINNYHDSKKHDFLEDHYHGILDDDCPLDKSPLDEINHELMSEQLNRFHLHDSLCDNDNLGENIDSLESHLKLKDMSYVIDTLDEQVSFTKPSDANAQLLGYSLDNKTNSVVPPGRHSYSIQGTLTPPFPFQNNYLLTAAVKAKDTNNEDVDSEIVGIIDRSLDILQQHKKDHSDPNSLSFDHLIDSCILNSPTRHLKINKFELRLLNYFSNVCIPMFAYGDGDSAFYSWKYQFPRLFVSSHLIRTAMYSFASINLLPIINLDRAIRDDNCLTYDIFRKQSVKYFMDTTSELNTKLSFLNLENIDTNSTAEVVISGILLYSYISIHHHQVCPLISFDNESTSLIAICRSIRDTIRLTLPLLSVHPGLGLFGSGLNAKASYELYPIFWKLLQDINEYYKDEINPEEEVIRETIQVIQRAANIGVEYNFPVPILRALFRISDEFYDLCQLKLRFPLRILFVYSCHCFLLHLQVYEHANIWLDYIQWYIQLGNNYADDITLYKLIVEKKYRITEVSFLKHFDPELIYNSL